MSELNEAIDETIAGIEISLGQDGTYWEPLHASIRVLNLVRDLGPNLVGLSNEDFESMLLKAIKGFTNGTTICNH